MAGYYVPKGDPSTLPPKNAVTRDQHISLREPVTKARHARLAEEAAKTQSPSSVSDVVLPKSWQKPFYQNGIPYQNTGWMLSGGRKNPGWEASKGMRQAIFQETLSRTGLPMTSSSINPVFSHAPKPEIINKPTVKKGSTNVIWQEPSWLVKR